MYGISFRPRKNRAESHLGRLVSETDFQLAQLDKSPPPRVKTSASCGTETTKVARNGFSAAARGVRGSDLAVELRSFFFFLFLSIF